MSFRIPAEFVVATALPTPDEIVAGYREGWLDEGGVVGVALSEMVAGVDLDDVMNNIALLLSDELDLVRGLLAEIPPADPPSATDQYWIFVVLCWIFEHRTDFDDPLGAVEMLYADFGYPVEIEGLVRYMPGPVGEQASLVAIERRWVDFLELNRDQFAIRSSAMIG